MLWLLLCAMLVLSPLLMMGALYWTIRQSERANTNRSPVERELSTAIEAAPAARAAASRQVELNGETVGLEAQFLVAPRRAIREAEERLRARGAALSEATVGPDASALVLRLAFEDLMRRLEATARARR